MVIWIAIQKRTLEGAKATIHKGWTTTMCLDEEIDDSAVVIVIVILRVNGVGTCTIAANVHHSPLPGVYQKPKVKLPSDWIRGGWVGRFFCRKKNGKFKSGTLFQVQKNG
jgi:hypothetical protein